MKLAQLLNEERFTRSPDVIKAWLKGHGFTLADLKIIGGKVHANTNSKRGTAESKIPPPQRPAIGTLPFEFADSFPMGLNLDNFGLVNLEGLPKRMSSPHGYLNISRNKLVDLKGCPEEVTYLTVAGMSTLKSLAGGPKKCKSLHLTDLQGLTTLKDVHKHLGEIRLLTIASCDNIKDSILGLILIPGLTKVETLSPDKDPFNMAVKIVNKHLRTGRAGVLAAQQELLDAGLDDYAKI